MLSVESPGRLIKTARVQRRLSQEGLGVEIGVSQQTIGRWEAGKDQPSPEHWARLEQVLGIPTDVFERFHVERGSVEVLRDEIRNVRSEVGDLRAEIAQVRTLLELVRKRIENGSHS